MASSHDTLLAVKGADVVGPLGGGPGGGGCPVMLTKGTETGMVEQRVIDLLALHLPNARVVELEGDSPLSANRTWFDHARLTRNPISPGQRAFYLIQN